LLDLDQEPFEALWRCVGEVLRGYEVALPERPIAPEIDEHALRHAVEAYDFSRPTEPRALIEAVARALREGQVHTAHPRYFGPFNPAPAALAVLAEALVAAHNPQLATRGHAPWPVAVEEHLLRAIGERFGYTPEAVEGTFTSGGAEANATALLVALAAAFPEVGSRGVRSLPGEPTLYTSSESHPTIARAARAAGLGREAVRVIPADARSRMKPGALREAIARDRAAGALPFLIVATAGTTAAGAIDPIVELASVAERERCWLHVDAAWGGLAALVPELAGALDGCARADSITFDPHKAMSVPLSAGAYLSRQRGALERVFHDRAGYMPRDASRDPYARSMGWSRRFVGLKVLLPLAAAGWDGYSASLRAQIALADLLRERLRTGGWQIVNDTPLPVVCFVDMTRSDGATARFLEGVARATIASGGGWLSVVRFSNGGPALRACVNSHRTRAHDIERLAASLDAARAAQVSS
jgi:glutamate/tyrosine decarboxylase-like PLP-dependent enzyme